MKRKMLALTMAAVMAASMTACGGSKPAETTAAATTAESKTGDAAAKSKADDTTAAASDKVYKIATDTTFAPFEFENDKGEMVGVDLDILKAISEDQGFQYELVVAGF